MQTTWSVDSAHVISNSHGLIDSPGMQALLIGNADDLVDELCTCKSSTMTLSCSLRVPGLNLT